MSKRLFIFASWDQDCIIDSSVTFYLGALSELGDIIFVSDCDTCADELAKLKSIPNIIHIISGRHGEYDFGSYKRGYAYAADNKILEKYDWIYFVNDSVYGPLRPLGPVLQEMESKNADAVGMYHVNRHDISAHLQTWFIGVTKRVGKEEWFAEFLQNIRARENKSDIVIEYEFGMSGLLCRHGCEFGGLISARENEDGFRNPALALSRGLPFVKKSRIAMSNIRNARAIRKYIPENIMMMIFRDMKRHDFGFGHYRRIISFRLFGFIPILDIQRHYNDKKIKVFLFKYIPILGMNF
ncbi:MAG: rhamnan synthesis F family protein [Alphaproteobacteria bacterium]|nr:rhamnan synthesis F family protein [Alphaproteobacteria bacterium]